MSNITLDVATPERVAVELPIAGIGSRAIAYFVDVALLFAVGVTLYFGFTLIVRDPIDVFVEASSTLRIAGGLVVFFLIWVYWTVAEVVMHGQTFGKRVMRIRVVRADGSPITALESAIRNLLRIVDFLPMCYPIGVVTMLIDKRHRRIGDLVAGTVLVREEKVDLAKYEKAAALESAHVLTAQDLETVTGFLQRFDALEPDARLRLGRQLAGRLGLAPEQVAQLDASQVRAFLSSKVGGA